MLLDSRFAPRAAGRSASAVLLVWLSAGCSSATAPAPQPVTPVAPSCTFTNPRFNGADPSVVFRNGQYYSVQSTGRAIQVLRSERLTQMNRNPVPVWQAPDTGWNRSNVWAPELAFVDGRWHIYYAAGRTNPGEQFTTQRTGVLRALTDDPQGPYEAIGPLYTGDGPPRVTTGADTSNVWAIDMTVGRIGGQLYAVWSGWERNATTDKTVQNLYIAPMRDPVTLAGPRVRLSVPEGWELGPELDLLEGPEILQRDGQTFIVYSTRDSWLPTYSLGMLRLRPGADPLDPASYTKSPGPVFTAANGVVGVGHHSTTVSPDGREHWLVYHAKTSSAPGWDRVVRMQRFTWRADGSPDFGVPVRSDSALALPSGEACTP